MRNGTSRVPYEKNEDSYVGSTPVSTMMASEDYEEQAGLFPTDSLRNGARPFPTKESKKALKILSAFA